MANGHVEIHDPFLNHRDPKPTSDSDGMEDSVEYRLLMAYAKRRRPQGEPASRVRPASSEPPCLLTTDRTEEEEEAEKRRKRKKTKRRLRMKGWRRNIFSCIKPRTEDGEPRLMNAALPGVADRCGRLEDVSVKEEEEEEEEEEWNETALRLTKIADEMPFMPPDVETDSPEDADVDVNVEKLIGLLLRGAGDRLNEKELKDAAISSELFLNYAFFKLLMTTLLTRMGLRSRHPDSPGPTASPKTQIAVACEVTSRLSAVTSLPRSRLLDHGARYLQHYYSPWALRQGGYEEAFYSDDDDDDDDQ